MGCQMGMDYVSPSFRLCCRVILADKLPLQVCDSTVAALELFRVDYSELLRLPLSSEDSVLPPSLLAGLLSLVVATRGKLISLGVSDVRFMLRHAPMKSY